jgi:hypothetical protein
MLQPGQPIRPIVVPEPAVREVALGTEPADVAEPVRLGLAALPAHDEDGGAFLLDDGAR